MFVAQISISCLVNPPKPGDESYEQYNRERTEELASLRRRAHMVTNAFNSLEGVTCNFTEGAMYSFPRVSVRLLHPFQKTVCELRAQNIVSNLRQQTIRIST
jgi:aspartate/methionine/tyrosine aminotransferase